MTDIRDLPLGQRLHFQEGRHYRLPTWEMKDRLISAARNAGLTASISDSGMAGHLFLTLQDPTSTMVPLTAA